MLSTEPSRRSGLQPANIDSQKMLTNAILVTVTAAQNSKASRGLGHTHRPPALPTFLNLQSPGSPDMALEGQPFRSPLEPCLLVKTTGSRTS